MIQIMINSILCFLCIRWFQVYSNAIQVRGAYLRKHVPRLKKRKLPKAHLSKNFYRLYKFIAIQTAAGTHAEEIYKSLYKIVREKELKEDLMAFSVMLTQRHELNLGLDLLKKRFDFDEGIIFVEMLESMAGTGLSKESFSRLDQMLFQKYLSEIRAQTEKVKQTYFISVVLFTMVTVGMLLIPLIHQMMFSAKQIFV